MKSSNLRWFDAARGSAAIIVLVAHGNQVFRSRFTGGTDGMSIVLGTAAEYAVYAFFLMSGYLITLSIRSNIRRNGRFDGAEYASARAARIYPPLIGAILIVIGVGVAIKTLHLPAIDLPGRPQYAFDYSEIWPVLSMRGGLGIADGPLWSLFIEGQIYIIAGGIAMIGWSRKTAPVLIGFVAVYVGIRLQKNEYFMFYGAIWLSGSLLSFIPISLELSLPPRLIAATGGFSYSLYVIHFPLLLLAWSFTQTLIDGSIYRATGIAALSCTVIILMASRAALFLETHRALKVLINSAFYCLSAQPAAAQTVVELEDA